MSKEFVARGDGSFYLHGSCEPPGACPTGVRARRVPEAIRANYPTLTADLAAREQVADQFNEAHPAAPGNPRNEVFSLDKNVDRFANILHPNH